MGARCGRDRAPALDALALSLLRVDRVTHARPLGGILFYLDLGRGGASSAGSRFRPPPPPPPAIPGARWATGLDPVAACAADAIVIPPATRAHYLVLDAVAFVFAIVDRFSHKRALGDILGYLAMGARRERGRDPAPALSGIASRAGSRPISQLK